MTVLGLNYMTMKKTWIFSVTLLVLVLQCAQQSHSLNIARYSESPVQYHIQADTGGDRFFRYQTYNGQWRKEKRLRNGKVIGAYGWTDDKGILRLYDYLADEHGYRVVRERSMKVADDDFPGKNGHVPDRKNINANRVIRKRRPASYNSIRRSNLEKARKRSHDLEKLLPNTKKEKISSFSDSKDDIAPRTLNVGPSESNSFPVSGNEENILLPQASVTNSPLTNNIPSVHDFGKSITNNKIIKSDKKDLEPHKKSVIKNGRFLMRGKKLRLFDAINNDTSTIGDLIETTGQNSLQITGHTISTKKEQMGNIKQYDKISNKLNNTLSANLTENTDMRIPSKRPKTSMSRLLRARQRQNSKKSISVPSLYGESNAISLIDPPPAKSTARAHSNVRQRNRQLTRMVAKSRDKSLVPNQSELLSRDEGSSSKDSISLLTPLTNPGPELVRKKRKHSFLDSPTNALQTVTSDSDSQTTIDFDAGNQFHFEVTGKDGTRVGRHGYVDPLGFLRITNYVSSAAGHTEQRTSQFVGVRRIGEGDYRCHSSCIQTSS